MSTADIDSLTKAVIQTMYKWQDGWRFCDEKLVEAKWAKKFGFKYPPSLIYSDDCACQIIVDMDSELFGNGCGCICHEKTAELATMIVATIKAELLAKMPKIKNEYAVPPKRTGELGDGLIEGVPDFYTIKRNNIIREITKLLEEL